MSRAEPGPRLDGPGVLGLVTGVIYWVALTRGVALPQPTGPEQPIRRELSSRSRGAAATRSRELRSQSRTWELSSRGAEQPEPGAAAGAAEPEPDMGAEQPGS